MKILLVQPRKPDASFGGDDFALFEPLALEYLASAVNDKHEVKILDLRLEDTFDETLQEFQPDVLGITAYTVHVNVANRLFQRAKKWNPKLFTMVGGHHVTVAYQDFVLPEVDMIVVGEGPAPFREVIDRLEVGRRDFDGIPGTVFMKGDELVVNENIQYDLDTIKFPDRSLTKHYRKHYSSEWMSPIASIRTSKGCPFRCSYCALWTLTGKRYLTREPAEIIKELREIEEPYIFLADDESFIQVDRMMELAKAIGESGIKKQYYLYVRADTTVRHPELLEEWKKIGLRRVFVGLEFFRDADLKAVNKGSTAVKNTDAIKIIQDLELDLFPAFIIRPEWDKQDFRELTEFCKSQNFDFVGFSVLTPLPGTHLHKEVKDQMILRNFDYYDFVHSLLPLKLPAKEFYKEYLGLIDNTRSLTAKLAFLKKYPVRELPGLMKKGLLFYEQFKQIYKAYDRLDEINASQTPWGIEPTFGWSGTTGTLVKLQKDKKGKLLPILDEASTS
jgi:radical SAM superfamily enzyme YgiQ (UPF0313 family)